MSAQTFETCSVKLPRNVAVRSDEGESSRRMK